LSAGIGYGTTMICFSLNVYYIVILAWTLHYFWNSFSAELPWSSCNNWWNTERCFSPLDPSTHHTNLTKVDSVVEYWE